MKKNLIKGMAMLCVSVAFVSCSHDSVYDENFVNKQKELSYEEAFIKQFGPVSPDQEWDFTKVSTARTRAEESAAVINQLPAFNTDGSGKEGFEWIWESGDPTKGELNNSDLATLLKSSNKTTILNAVAAAEETPWKPETYKNVYFRLYAITGDDQLSSFKRIGIHLPTGENYWLAQGNPSGTYWTNGNTIMARPRYLDFTKLPAGTTWFKISQASGGSQNNPIKASEHPLDKFKEVTVEINNKTYTFWAFDTTGNGVSDLILWVKAEEKPVEIVTEKRYMAEDLGGNGDIDFNDVVFDIVDTNGDQKGYVRALGGKLDIEIFVGGKSCWRKGNSTIPVNEMRNTENPKFHDTLATFNVEGWDDNANNVSIAVYGDGSKVDAVTYINFPVKGSIPRMIAVSTKKYWQIEKKPVPDMNWFITLDE